jgi:hypothetical protein
VVVVAFCARSAQHAAGIERHWLYRRWMVKIKRTEDFTMPSRFDQVRVMALLESLLPPRVAAQPVG